MTEEQHAEMEESMSIHVTPHKNGTHYTVKKVGSAMKKHGGIKKGEHLSDTEIDDAGGSGIKVHHENVEEAMLGFNGADRLNGGKSLDPKHKSSGSHIDYHFRRDGGPSKGSAGDQDKHRYQIAKKLGYQAEAHGDDQAKVDDTKAQMHETAADKYAAFMTQQNKSMSPSNQWQALAKKD